MTPSDSIWELKDVLLLVQDAGEQLKHYNALDRPYDITSLNLNTWSPITDHQIEGAIELCKSKGLAYIHQNCKTEILFQVFNEVKN